MRFEYDLAKSAANKAKHGIDFEEAQALWRDSNAITEAVPTRGEPRFLITGRIREKLWTAVVTYRNENIRIISMRRARNHEIEEYLRQRI